MSSSHSQAVLTVEDEILIRSLMANALSEYGMKVYEAGDADEAIHLLEEKQDIRLIFTDINMPGSMDGVRLAHAVRDRWPPVKIIVASGKMMPDAGELPADSTFVAKPYLPYPMAEKIQSLMAA